MNPYESPQEVAPRKLSWRLLLLLPAALLFLAVGYELLLHVGVYELANRSARPLPPTMYTEHLGLVVGATALALAFTAAAFSKQPVKTSQHLT
jgi:hypothetical protein